MNKAEILEKLSQVQHELANQKEKLNTLISSPLWTQIISDERDETVEIMRGVGESIYDLIDLQKKILLKK